ncbi:MFS transporter [Curtobacterium sp. MCPF17_021]|uniref:MFS transporter n=1 Tax=Curtobacterium sp. MCPF17_021 TaxID=2175639 RepID=UPI000DA7442B|nr:MFS transporter [Curtobacterium sp. MCPF17_021]WIE83313.1 MFS transporter [Curtobacterium sp. MCPF17_021]
MSLPPAPALGSTNDPGLKSAIGKATKHLMPMLVILYFVAFLDRTNVGFAEEALRVDRGISDAAFALGAGIFFIGYAIFEIPSNLLLKRFGARFWLARIAVTWGIVAALFAFTTNDTMFIILRFILGVTEAGLFPGVIMYLSEWFPNKVRVRMFAIFYLAQPFSQMIGAPLSGGLISVGDQVTPFHGWQVMFAGEGILAVLAGIAALVFLTNSPQQAKWLEPGEKASLTAAMEREDTARSEDGPKGIWRAMGSGRVWYFTIIYFCLQVAVYGTTFYLPQQVSSLLGQDVGWQVGLVSAIPWLVGLVACYLIGSRADSVGRRRRWGTLFYVTTGLSILGSAWAGANGQPVLGILFITLAVASFLAVGPITWAYPTAFLTGAAAAAGIGLINSLGNLGGFVAPIMRTAINEVVPTDSGAFGIVSLGVLAFVAAVMIFCTKFFRGAKADELLDTSHVRTTDPKGSKR